MSIEQPDPGIEARREALENGSGFSADSARIHLGEKIVAGTTELPRFSRPQHQPRPSGRAPAKVSGRDVSRDIANQAAVEQPINPIQQRETNLRGRAKFEAALDEMYGKNRHIDAIVAKVHEMVPIDPDNVAGSEAARQRMINAQLSTYFDRRA